MRILSTIFLIFLLVLPVFGNAQSSGGSPPSSLISLAKEFVTLLARNDFPGAVGYYDQAMKTALPEEKLKGTWT